MGFCVAERPILCGGVARPVRNWPGLRRFSPVTRASRRSSERARWAPRLSSATAWISSTMTVRTRRRCSRDLAGGEEDVEGLGRGDEDVRRVAEHGGTLFGESVAGADGGADLGGEVAALQGELLDLGQGGVEVFLDVVGEGFERADVDDLGAGRELAGEGLCGGAGRCRLEMRRGFCRSRWGRR